MELSELMDQLRSKKIKIETRPNFKTYYRIFPHVVRFSNNGQKHENVYPTQIKIRSSLSKLNADRFKVRKEYYDLNVYCMDPVEVLEAVPPALLKKLKIVVEVMETKVLDQCMIKPELPRAITRVVKTLPWGGYRYKVYWPQHWRQMHYVIGKETFSLIIDHINSDENTKRFGLRQTQELKNFRYWGSNYFYTNSEDLLCLISLIDQRFIHKIDKFITLEEIDEQAASRDTNQ